MPVTIPTLTPPPQPNPYKGFNFIARTYNTDGPIQVDANTFGFMLTNTGDQVATVNGIILYPGDPASNILGDSRSIGTPAENLAFKGQLNVIFSGAGAKALEVITTYYI